MATVVALLIVVLAVYVAGTLELRHNRRSAQRDAEVIDAENAAYRRGWQDAMNQQNTPEKGHVEGRWIL